jgi:hypothetical protein
MGYETEYQLEVPEYQLKAVLKHIESLDLPWKETILEALGLWGSSPVKWYGHEEDMAKIAEPFPDTLFTLHGVGEEFPDVWVKYFLNGEIRQGKATITYPKYGELA